MAALPLVILGGGAPSAGAPPVGASAPVGDGDGWVIDVDLDQPTQIHADGAGNLYVYDHGPRTITRIEPDGRSTVVVGNGTEGRPVEGPADRTPLGWIEDMTVTDDGTIHLVDHIYYTAATVTPDGQLSFIPEGTWGTPSGIGIDAAGNVYVADCGAETVRRVAPDGSVSVVLDGSSGVPGWNGSFHPETIEVLPDGTVYVEDTGNWTIDRRTPDGTWSVFAGTGEQPQRPRPGPASESTVYASSMAAAPDGALWFASLVEGLVRITPDGELTAYRLPPGPDNSATFVDAVGFTHDGRLVVAPRNQEGLLVLGPDDLTEWDPENPFDHPPVEKVEPTWTTRATETARAGKRYRPYLMLSDASGQRATGTVQLVVQGRVVAERALANGTARLRAVLPWKRGRHVVSVTYSGDDRFDAVTVDLTVTVKPRRR